MSGFASLAARVDGLAGRVARIEEALGLAGEGGPESAVGLEARVGTGVEVGVEGLALDDVGEGVGGGGAFGDDGGASHGVPEAIVGGGGDDEWVQRGGSGLREGDGGAAYETEGGGLERLIGGGVFAVAGALVVIAGAGLGLKLVWDLGWFRVLSDEWKSAGMGAFGAALIAAGEVARRRYGRAAGEGLCAAGLGVLFATVYAMTARFELLGWESGVGALLGVAVLGFVVAARGGLAVTAAVSVLGGFGVPLLLGRPEGSVGTLAVYWLALSGMAHALTAWRGAAFAPARAVAWWGSVVIGGGWAFWQITDGRADWGAVFVCGVWLLAHLEAWRVSTRSAEEWPARLLGRTVGGCVSTTLWAAVLGLAAAEALGWELWTVAAALGAANVALALVAAPGVRGLLRAPGEAREGLGVALALTGGALGVVAAMLAYGGWLEPVLLIALGVSSVAVGMRAKADWIAVYGVCVLALGTVRAMFSVPLGEGALLSTSGLELTRWSAVVGLAGVAWLVAAFVRRAQEGAAFGWVSLGVLFVAALDVGVDLRWVCGVWAALAAAFVVGRRVDARLRMGAVGLGGLMASCLMWGVAYLWNGWDTDLALGAGVWSVHEGVLFALALGALVVAASRVVWRGSGDESARRYFAIVGFGGAGALVLTATSFDVARLADLVTEDQTARRALVSVWWGVYGVGLLALGAARSLSGARYAGLALLSVATVKAVVFDLADIAPGWRVASFLLLGLLLLGVATAYARWSARGGRTGR